MLSQTLALNSLIFQTYLPIQKVFLDPLGKTLYIYSIPLLNVKLM